MTAPSIAVQFACMTLRFAPVECEVQSRAQTVDESGSATSDDSGGEQSLPSTVNSSRLTLRCLTASRASIPLLLFT